MGGMWLTMICDGLCWLYRQRRRFTHFISTWIGRLESSPPDSYLDKCAFSRVQSIDRADF